MTQPTQPTHHHPSRTRRIEGSREEPPQDGGPDAAVAHGLEPRLSEPLPQVPRERAPERAGGAQRAGERRRRRRRPGDLEPAMGLEPLESRSRLVRPRLRPRRKHASRIARHDVARRVHQTGPEIGQRFVVRRAVGAIDGIDVGELDLVLVHQANLRIIEGVQKQLGLPAEKVPHNIERYGNTTAATLPLLYHECRQNGLAAPGRLIAFTALGSGLHWGAALYRA